jgi:hypothetical protein
MQFLRATRPVRPIEDVEQCACSSPAVFNFSLQNGFPKCKELSSAGGGASAVSDAIPEEAAPWQARVYEKIVDVRMPGRITYGQEDARSGDVIDGAA